MEEFNCNHTGDGSDQEKVNDEYVKTWIVPQQIKHEADNVNENGVKCMQRTQDHITKPKLVAHTSDGETKQDVDCGFTKGRSGEEVDARTAPKSETDDVVKWVVTQSNPTDTEV